MEVTASYLRKNVYTLLDQVAQTGVPLDIKRKGKHLRIIPTKPKSKLDNLKKRRILACDPEDIVHLDWSDTWQK